MDKVTQVVQESFARFWSNCLEIPGLAQMAEQYSQLLLPLLEVLEQHLLSLSVTSPRVLEVGCGRAVLSYGLAERVHGDYWALDLLPEALAVAEEMGHFFAKPIRLAQGDARALGFADEVFDMVFSQGLLEHFIDPLPLLREQARIVKREGRLAIDVPQKYNPYTRIKRKLIERGAWEYGWETEFSYGELKRLGAKVGLRVVDASGWECDRRGRWLIARLAGRLERMGGVATPCGRGVGSLWRGIEDRFAPYLKMCLTVVFEKA